MFVLLNLRKTKHSAYYFSILMIPEISTDIGQGLVHVCHNAIGFVCSTNKFYIYKKKKITIYSVGQIILS